MWMWWQMHWTTSNQLYLEHGQICHFYNFSVLQASERTLKFNCDVAEIPSNNPLSRVATYLDTTMLLPISKRLSRKSEIRKEKQKQLFYAICWALTLWITNVPPKRIATAIGGVRRFVFQCIMSTRQALNQEEECREVFERDRICYGKGMKHDLFGRGIGWSGHRSIHWTV